jgi:hypothetical protein
MGMNGVCWPDDDARVELVVRAGGSSRADAGVRPDDDRGSVADPGRPEASAPPPPPSGPVLPVPGSGAVASGRVVRGRPGTHPEPRAVGSPTTGAPVGEVRPAAATLGPGTDAAPDVEAGRPPGRSVDAPLPADTGVEPFVVETVPAGLPPTAGTTAGPLPPEPPPPEAAAGSVPPGTGPATAGDEPAREGTALAGPTLDAPPPGQAGAWVRASMDVLGAATVGGSNGWKM